MIEIKNLSKTFELSGHHIHALDDVSLTINDGDIYGIIGMSGAGKSTLVRCINMLERPTSGEVIIDGKSMGSLSGAELRDMRRNVTMIFQNFNLLMQRTCLKNICFPLELEHKDKAEAKKTAMELLETVGLPDKANAYPAQLSGGQQQRIAIARALATNPKVLLCDEATSALDPKTTNSILELIRDINKKFGITVIIITHQMSVVQAVCNRVAILERGVVAEEGDVCDIFSNPKSSAAKKLVFSDGTSGLSALGESESAVRVIFNGANTASQPFIAQMAIDTGIKANIISASLRTADYKTFGNMILSVKKTELAAVLNYIGRNTEMFAEEVTCDVQ